MDKINTPILFFINLALVVIVATLIFGLSALALIGVIAAPVMLIILVTLTFPKKPSE